MAGYKPLTAVIETVQQQQQQAETNGEHAVCWEYLQPLSCRMHCCVCVRVSMFMLVFAGLVEEVRSEREAKGRERSVKGCSDSVFSSQCIGTTDWRMQ